MAESIFAHLVQAEGLQDQILVDSAGTGDWHVGQRPHKGTLGILDRYQLREGSRARTLAPADFQRFQYLVVMDRQNLANVQRALAKGHTSETEVALLMSFAGQEGVHEVPDPYFTGDFEETYRLVTAGCAGLLQHIRNEHRI